MHRDSTLATNPMGDPLTILSDCPAGPVCTGYNPQPYNPQPIVLSLRGPDGFIIY
ncbi:MAG: hypothetical protein P8K78_08360 [Pirellulales bacterium]|nr:hypothetical protein [Pirellulales bacterium]